MAMAEAQYVEREVTKVERVRDGVILALSEQEAQVLRDILAAIGGSERSERRYVRSINQALIQAGYSYRPRSVSGMDGSITFDDPPKGV